MNFVRLLVAVLLSLASLASPVLAAAPSDEKITLRLLTYFTSADPVTPMYAGVYKQFQQDFPNVTIEHEGLESANARTKLTIEMASGNPPDISYMVTSLGQQFGKDKLLLDLRPMLMADKKWMSTYYPAALEAFTFEGKIFLAPVNIHVGGLYYNKEVLKKAGLQGPAATWAELLQQVKKIKATGAYPFVTGGKDFRFAWFMTQLLLRTGGATRLRALADGTEVTGWDKPENGFIDALRLFKELIDAGAFPPGLNGMARDVSRMMFVQNRAAMYYEGTWKIGVWEQLGGPAFLNNVGWTTFPTVEGAKGDQDGVVAGPVLGWGISGRLTGKKRDMAVELVKRLTSQQIATRMLLEIKQPTGTIPAEGALGQIHPMLAAQLKLYHNAKHVALPVDVNVVPPVDNAIKKVACPAIVDGSMTPAQAAAEVNKYAKEYFAAAGKK